MAGIDLGNAWADGVWEEGVWADDVWAGQEDAGGQEGAVTSTALTNRQHGVLATMRRAALIIALLFLLGAS